MRAKESNIIKIKKEWFSSSHGSQGVGPGKRKGAGCGLRKVVLEFRLGFQVGEENLGLYVPSHVEIINTVPGVYIQDN